MIHESYPWKYDLIKNKKILQQYSKSMFLEDSDQIYVILEKAIFYSAFIIRKLIDCKCKVSNAVDNYSIKVDKIYPIKQITDFYNQINNDNYDWEHTQTINISGKNICNWLIHSVVFSFLVSEEKIDSFVVSSDYDKNKVLYRINIDDWIKYMDFVATDNIVSIKIRYDQKLNNHTFTNKIRE